MASRIMLIPAGENAGLTTVSLGMLRALQQQGLAVNFFKPVAQPKTDNKQQEQSTAIVTTYGQMNTATPLSLEYVETMISEDKTDVLLEDIIELFEKHYKDEDIVLIEGLVANPRYPFTVRLNRDISNALDAKLVMVMNPGAKNKAQINHQLEIAADNYGGHKSRKLMGCIFNKINAPLDEDGHICLDLRQNVAENTLSEKLITLQSLPIFNKQFNQLGAVTWNADLNAPRVHDLQQHLHAQIVNSGQEDEGLFRRIRSIHFCAREIHNMLPVIKPGALLVVSADRSDVIVAACLATLNGTRLGAILLTGTYEPDPRIMSFCAQALATGLPILKVNLSTWDTAIKLQYFNQEVPTDDTQRISWVMDHTASCIDESWIKSLSKTAANGRRMSPPAFRYKLTQLSRKANKTIVLPEGNEPRTIAAAAICAERGLANCVLLGDPTKITRVATLQGINLAHEKIQLVAPEEVRSSYISPMVKLREHKGLSPMIAEQQLMDNNVLGTMMLQNGDVDGLVSGAVSTTANTIRPALQLIKTASNASLVSSVFFMLLPDQVLVYGDCAINPDPNAEQLADIAIQSADSAAAFGIEPKVAMISYSTGNSGTGQDVDKVKLATKLAQSKRPDLMIDGPLQYDAAVMESVASKKAPNSPVAGKATVLVFPDLNTGNTTYKAVQRSADLLSIGPMLQGLNKPVNDLSRGALVDDIVFTIALTAIQASH
ncbi:phosphate acetyltransferase [Agaribacter flavus]|uniref:Phosphate acetyltransferase n=1 Tax=Agaribacter flavus TaxID=1902781 RepID=A0ABV7FSI6_9ALTE